MARLLRLSGVLLTFGITCFLSGVFERWKEDGPEIVRLVGRSRDTGVPYMLGERVGNGWVVEVADLARGMECIGLVGVLAEGIVGAWVAAAGGGIEQGDCPVASLFCKF